MKYLFLPFFIILSSNSFSQEKSGWEDISKFDHMIHFRMGTLDKEYFKSTVSFRADKITAHYLDNNYFSTEITNPLFYLFESEVANPDLQNSGFELNAEKYPKIYGPLKFNLEYRNKNMASNSLLSLGKIDLNPSAFPKVKQLYLLPYLGRPNISSFKNLKSFSIQDHYYNTVMSIKYSIDSSIRRENVWIRYAGDQQLTKELHQLEKLEYLRIDIPQKINISLDENDLFFIDELPENFFSKGTLKYLYTDGINFLPIDYKNLRKLDYLEMKQFYFPEILNLALLFYIDNKDSTQGQWHFYLKNLVDLEKSKIDISTGTVQTYYKNGQLLSEGQLIKDVPDGDWKFWYPNGKLCEERHYSNGTRIGTWIFRSNGNSIDTTLIMKYENGNLIYRKEFNQDYVFSFCEDSPEHRSHAQITLEYNINEITKDSTQITVIYNNGIREHIQTWTSNNNIWKYERIEKCDGFIKLIEQQSGFLFEVANDIFRDIELNNYQKTTNRYSYSMNLNNCQLEEVLYSIDPITGEQMVDKVINSVIQTDDWDCQYLR